MRRVALAALAALALMVAGLLGLYVWREPIAAALAEHYLAGLGVPSSIRFERLDTRRVIARVVLGEPARPDLTATIAASLAWQGLTPRLRTVEISPALLRARFDGRQLRLGSLDRLRRTFAARGTPATGSGAVAPAATAVDVDLRHARVLLDTPEGALTLDGDARLAAGRLQSFSVVLQPTTLRATGLVAQISSGRLRATAAGAGWNVRARLLARGTFDAGGAALSAGPVRLQIAVDDLVPGAGGVAGGPLRVSARLDALSAHQGTAQPEELGAARLELTLAAQRARLTAARAGRASLDGLTVQLHADALRARLPQGSARVPSLTASARGTFSLRAGQPAADLQASAQLSAALASPQLRAEVRRLASGLHEPGVAAALEAALRQFSVSAPQLHVLLTPRLVRCEAQVPVTVRAADGVQVLLAPEGRLPLLSAASGSASGALRLRLSGRGLPHLRLAIGSYTLGRDASGRPRASAHVAMAAQLSAPPLRGLSVSAVARAQLRGAHWRIVLARCAPIGLRALSFPSPGSAAGSGPASPGISGLRIALCPAAGPLLQGDAHAWALQGLWRSLTLRAPAADVALSAGSGTLQASGTAGAIRTATLSISSARLADEARPARFNPLGLAGTMALSGDRWRGTLAVHHGASVRPIATAQLQYSPASSDLEAQLEVGPLTFAPDGLQPAALSALLGRLRDASGGLKFLGHLAWSHGALHSSGVLSLTNFGFTSPVGPVRRINASIQLRSLLPLRSAPGQLIRVGSLGSVASVTQVAARFQLLPDAVRIEEATMHAAGGTVSLDATTVPMNPKATINATVRVHDIDLNELVAASSLASSIKLQVHVSGAIPFSIGPAGVRFHGGELASSAPGQLQIARTVWGSVAQAGQTNAFQDFAFQALAHLKIEQLSGALNSLPGGHLGLLLHIRGENDPPVPAVPRIGLLALLRGHAFDKPMPLPAGTPIDLTLDTTLNLDELLAALRPSSPTTH